MRFRLVSVCLVVVVALTGLGLPADLARAGQPPQASPVVAVDNAALVRALIMEQVLRADKVPMRDMLDLAVRFKHASAGASRVACAVPAAEAVGSRQSFWIDDQVDHVCAEHPATLRYITPHLYMWVEDGYSVSDEDLKRSADRFESEIYPTTRLAFGCEWEPGVDGDEHISIFNGRVPGVGGYYSDADEFTKSVNQYSNEKELFYINLDNAQPGTDTYDGILAHEFQHMIHWNISRTVQRNAETWVDEGMAELSAELNGFDHMSSYGAFLARSNTQLTDWADNPNDAAPHYGAAHSFMHYLMTRFGDDLIRAFISDPQTGLAALDDVLLQQHRGVTADQVFVDWTLANYLGDAQVGDGRYAARLGDLPPISSASFEEYPVEKDGQVRQYGTQYIDLKGADGASASKGLDLEVDFQGAPTVKLTANDAHSGSFQWWSTRGDNSDMTLTRAFDLTRVKSASLTFWTWYDIEKDWDYAYVAVSTDGGHTWDSLKGGHNADLNVSGNNLGWGYTGTSAAVDSQGSNSEGTDPQPAWVQERMDLTPYAGKQILLRFEYVTDDGCNLTGFGVDDIRIPELGFSDDVESGVNGWVAKGFVRSDNLVPEHFIVQLIEFGPQIRVRTLNPEPAPALQQASTFPATVEAELRSVEHTPYDVRVGDSLPSLAQKFLGDESAGDVLLAETNAQHDVDPSYAHIGNAHAVLAGTRIAVPTTDTARQELLSLRGRVESAVSAPANAAAEPNTDTAPGALQRIVVRGIGSGLTRAVLVISALAPVTTESGSYHLSVKPVGALASGR